MLDYNRRLRTALTLPLLSWDVVSMQRGHHFLTTTVEKDLKKLTSLQAHHSWDQSAKALADLLSSHVYEALVLTNQEELIEWVSDGFASMTGYGPEEVLHRKPDMLQNPNTDPGDTQIIRQHLTARKTFTATVLNERKNGEEYRCELHVVPLTSAGETTHFLALEREV
ncbi:PAS domain-containing protein [Marinoscillum furvescens]|uniref:PAS domain S-box-containing protein n=1 Tax=Marinoscillum furvescens DSM 4134 TaxID=1122208 RepID=A0A3D9L0Q2_MARFU|nr:PAS domain-containing protein [Marinoscillum furvescens]RED97024.1 PAS domain S-box-containing protein [Marinoscillum furvescens DSM 4134]